MLNLLYGNGLSVGVPSPGSRLTIVRDSPQQTGPPCSRGRVWYVRALAAGSNSRDFSAVGVEADFAKTNARYTGTKEEIFSLRRRACPGG